MKSFICLFAALMLSAPLVRAEDPAPAPFSRFNVGAQLAYWHIPDLDGFDINGAFGGSVIGQFRMHERFALELRMSGFSAIDSDDIHVSGKGWVENTTTLACLPLEAGIVGFWPLGETFSLYGGPGVGYYLFDGESRSKQGRWETTYDMDLQNEAGFYVLFGARAQLARKAALFAEAKYTWVETSMHYDVVALRGIDLYTDLEEDISFNGLAFAAGMLFTF